MATTKFLDSNGLLYVWSKIKTLVAGYYAKPQGGIPATDLADAVQQALTNISGKYVKPEGGIPLTDLAEAVRNAIENALSADSPALAGTPTAPTAAPGTNTQQLATTAYVMAAVADVLSGGYVPVDVLPEASAATMGRIYLVPSPDATAGNIKEEHITVRFGSEGAYTYDWESIGNTAMNLTGYWKREDLSSISNSEIDEICE